VSELRNFNHIVTLTFMWNKARISG